jgi:hypothetical protein
LGPYPVIIMVQKGNYSITGVHTMTGVDSYVCWESAVRKKYKRLQSVTMYP